MPRLEVVNEANKPVESVDVSDRVFATPVHASLVHQAVVMQRACARQGTASTKGRGEVSGSGKKPWRQKHTGRARAGSVRSPIWRHGGTVFGPRPRSYAFHLPKAAYRMALRSALSSKVAEGDVVVLADPAFPDIKTRYLAVVLRQLGVADRSVLLVVGGDDSQLSRMARNLPRVKVSSVERLNVYELLRYERIILLRSVLPKLEEYWA